MFCKIVVSPRQKVGAELLQAGEKMAKSVQRLLCGSRIPTRPSSANNRPHVVLMRECEIPNTICDESQSRN